jgi:hypothetical protein
VTLLTLDTNCIIPFVKHEPGNRPDELDALTALINAADDGSIELQLTASYDRDAARNRNDDGRARQLEWLASAPILPRRAAGLFVIGVYVLDGPDVVASDEDGELYDAIRAVVAPNVDFTLLDDATSDELGKITSDIDHLIASHKSGAAAFVTLDHRTILVHRLVLSELDITVLLPTEAASAYLT